MKFLLFGTGDYYERYKKWFDKGEVLALLDNSAAKQNTLLDGIPVLSPQDGIELPYDAVVILSFYVKEMRSQLIQLGVPENKIYHFYDLHGLIYRKEKKKPIQYYGDINYEYLTEIDPKPPEKRILLLSQDLTLGGPAIALFHAAEMLIKHGYQVVYGSMLDGPLRDRLLSAGIPVIVDVNLQIETMMETDWVNSFFLLVCNTINFHIFLSERNIDIPVIWWLHDSAFFYDGIKRETLCELDRRNMTVCSVGPVPEKAIREFIPDIFIRKLLYGVADQKKNGREETEKTKTVKGQQERKVCFVTIGYIEARKGQDILVQAIQALPADIREKAVFYLVGQDSSMLAQQLKTEIQYIPEIKVTGTVGREQINDLLDNADVFVCPSREDPMPTVAAEAMMHSVPCILSDAVGTADYVQNGIDGLLFHCGDAKELAAKIEWCMCHLDKLHEMGGRARKIYEKYFSMEVFEADLLNMVGLSGTV